MHKYYDILLSICLNKFVVVFCFYFGMCDNKLLQWKLTHTKAPPPFILTEFIKFTIQRENAASMKQLILSEWRILKAFENEEHCDVRITL